MSKGIPKSVSAQIAKECHLYPGDNDGMRISKSRLDDFIAKRDAAMLAEIQVIRTELTEQKQMISAIKKYRKPKLYTQAQVDGAVREARLDELEQVDQAYRWESIVTYDGFKKWHANRKRKLTNQSKPLEIDTFKPTKEPTE